MGERRLTLQLILDEATKLVRGSFRAIYLPVAIPVSAASGLLPIVQTLFFKNVGGGTSRPDFWVMLPSLAIFMASTLIFLLMLSLGNGALTAAAVDAVAGRPISMKRAWSMMFRPRIFGTLCLVWLASGVGYLFCLLPGIYASLIFSLVLPVMVEEDLAGTRAIGRSRALMEYNPRHDIASDPRLKVFLIFVAAAILTYALSLLVQLPMMVIQQIVMFRSIAGGNASDPASLMASLTWLQVPTTMIGVLAQIAVRLYSAFCVALLFVDVRQRKEGADLEAAIASLNPSPETLG